MWENGASRKERSIQSRKKHKKSIRIYLTPKGIFPHVDFDDRLIAFQDMVHGKKQPYDDNGHGTHIAGILGGSGGASHGRCRGVAPGCSFIGVKVLDRQGNGNKEHVLEAFQWLIQNRDRYHIRIVNISVGTTYRSDGDHRVLIHGVEQVWDAGMVVVAAEMLASKAGLGFLITRGSDSIDIALVLIGMILIGVVGALLSAIFSLIERRLCPWMNEKNQ